MRALLVVAACAIATVAAASRGATGRAPLIVYWSESPWPSIWAIRPDGSHRYRILRNRQNGKRPRLSPDREWVAFDGAPPGKAPLSDFDIQVVRADGTALRTLTTSPLWDHDAQWSPDGTLLSFSRLPPHHADARESEIWIVRRDGGGLRRVTPGFGARWSPDGKQLVYSVPTHKSAGDLYVVDAGGGESRALVSTPELEQAAGWSPDGKTILFTRYYDETGRSARVYVLNADGTGERKLARGIAGCWSPDGSRILYTSAFSSPLLVMDADGSHKRKLASVTASEPDWR